MLPIKWRILSCIVLAGLMLMVILMCNSSRLAEPGAGNFTPALVSFIQLPNVEDSVDLVSVISDTANTILTVSLSLYENPQIYSYKLRMKSLLPQNFCGGWEAQLLNSDLTDTLWIYLFQWDCEDMTWHQIIESAEDDYLSITIEDDGQTFTETYIQDGDTLVLTYVQYLYEGIHGETGKYTSAELATIDSLEDEFAAFYDTTAAINNNESGTLLTELIDSEEFWEWMYERMHDNPDHVHPEQLLAETLEEFCSDHHYCPIKCGDEDFWANAACWGCHLSYIICSIYDLFVQLLET